MPLDDHKNDLIFVYGSLCRGGPDAFHMEEAELIAHGQVEGRLYQISGRPAVVLGRGQGWVKGEFYSISHDRLEALDQYHGTGESCKRLHIPVEGWTKLGRGERVWTWEWTAPVSGSRSIASGDWMDYLFPWTPPWFAWIGTSCFIGAPVVCWVGMIALFIGGRWQVTCGVVALVASVLCPVVGLWAVSIGARRRERWRIFRGIITGLLILEGLAALACVGYFLFEDFS
ncbi:gamma-glutamylcyclotransferase family protein [Luteolibacter luteus]|uniref:Gamma-glutamylcyclotransferase n=1 Tax=Luteolibacter luteus TaxID=2728835 RepID=A0A858RFF0_9BACT|nr:gamma-glutamylcyclotransferase [Luteolibacter luteus]